MPSDACLQLLPKDISQNSLCSSVQTPVTETTDDAASPTTPGPFPSSDCCIGYFPDKKAAADQRRHPFPGPAPEFLAPDAQYEVIQEQGGQGGPYRPCSNLASTISSLNTYGQSYFKSASPPKSLNPGRKNLGSNISSLIQNLGANPAGLLYGEANSTEDEEMQIQGCHSDGTMDSGWQSGSEKQDRNGNDNRDNTTHRAVNV